MDEQATRKSRLGKLAAKRHALRRSKRLYAFLARWSRRHWARVTVVPR